MNVKVGLSIGFCGSDRRDVINIDDDELEGLTEQEKESLISEYVEEWANNYIETWWEVKEEK